MQRYQVKDEHGTVRVITATDPITACQRIADLHRVAVVAWRIDPDPVHVYTGEPA